MARPFMKLKQGDKEFDNMYKLMIKKDYCKLTFAFNNFVDLCAFMERALKTSEAEIEVVVYVDKEGEE
jgi:hypothetical protein